MWMLWIILLTVCLSLHQVLFHVNFWKFAFLSKLKNAFLKRVPQVRSNSAITSIIMHDCKDCSVFYTSFSLNINDALSVKRVQVDEVDTLRDPILFQAAFIVLNDSQHLLLRIGPQLWQVALTFDVVLKLKYIKFVAFEYRFEWWQFCLFIMAIILIPLLTL